MAKRRFSLRRFIFSTALLLLFSGVLWGVILSSGFIGGYFHALPLIPLFFLLVAVFSVLFMRKFMHEGGRRLVSRFTVLVLGRMLLDILFVVFGFLLLPDHRIGFVVVTLFCYILVLLLTVRGVLQE